MRQFSFFSILALLMALFGFFRLPVSAAEVDRVIDEADLLTSSEEEMLEESLCELADEFNYDIVILYADGIGISSPSEYAAKFYIDGGYGYTSDYNGALLLVDMEEREWYIYLSGDANDCFTDDALDDAEDSIISELSDDDYYDAAQVFISISESALSGDYGKSSSLLQNSSSTASDDSSNEFPLFSELIVTAVAIVIAFLVAGAAKRAMNTARKQQNAANYADPRGANITLARDTYLYSTVTKVKIESSSSSSGGRSSGGRRSGGRGGKF